VRGCTRQRRAFLLILVRASLLTADRKPVKLRPFYPRAPRARNANPRKVKAVCS
jgi:hypothetical protein